MADIAKAIEAEKNKRREEDGVAAYGNGNYALALTKFRRLAAQGHAKAQFNLGVMYGNGQGVAQDYTKTHMWFNIAAVKGDKDAVKNRDVIAGRMTAQQISEAQKMAGECIARNFKNCD